MAGRLLPFPLCWQPDLIPQLLAQPSTECYRIVPTYIDHWVIGKLEPLFARLTLALSQSVPPTILPKAIFGCQEGAILSICNRELRDIEWLDVKMKKTPRKCASVLLLLRVLQDDFAARYTAPPNIRQSIWAQSHSRPCIADLRYTVPNLRSPPMSSRWIVDLRDQSIKLWSNEILSNVVQFGANPFDRTPGAAA